MRAGFLEGHFFLFFNFLAELNGIWDHNSLTRDEKPHPLAVAAQSLNHWTTRTISRSGYYIHESVLNNNCFTYFMYFPEYVLH